MPQPTAPPRTPGHYQYRRLTYNILLAAFQKFEPTFYSISTIQALHIIELAYKNVKEREADIYLSRLRM